MQMISRLKRPIHTSKNEKDLSYMFATQSYINAKAVASLMVKAFQSKPQTLLNFCDEIKDDSLRYNLNRLQDPRTIAEKLQIHVENFTKGEKNPKKALHMIYSASKRRKVVSHTLKAILIFAAFNYRSTGSLERLKVRSLSESITENVTEPFEKAMRVIFPYINEPLIEER